METKTSRRSFLRLMASTTVVSVLAACGGAPEPRSTEVESPTAPAAAGASNPATEPTVVPTPEPIVVGEGGTEMTMWVQDFGPMVNAFQKAAENYTKQSGDAKITVQSLPFGDLQAKVIPAIAAGNEPEIMLGYTNWYVATDISKLFLPLDDYFGGRTELEKTIFPAALTTLNTPENKVYYLPYVTGLNGAATTLNVGHYNEKNIDYTTFTTYDDFAMAAKALTVTEGDVMKRAGLSIWDHALTMLKTWIWQMGGDFYNPEQGQWKLSSLEGEAGVQRLQDIYQKDKTASIDIATKEYDSFLQGRLSTQMQGAWTLGVVSTTNPDMKLDCVPTPKLANATTDVVYPDHTAVITLSRRLIQDDKKLQAALGLVKAVMSPDALISITDAYSGSLMSKTLYDDPRIETTKFGPVSKRVSESIWPRARYPQDRVANQGPALTEIQRALTKEITIKEALTNADVYLNEQEAQARERLQG